jgi:hypothetical protein
MRHDQGVRDFIFYAADAARDLCQHGWCPLVCRLHGCQPLRTAVLLPVHHVEAPLSITAAFISEQPLHQPAGRSMQFTGVAIRGYALCH